MSESKKASPSRDIIDRLIKERMKDHTPLKKILNIADVDDEVTKEYIKFEDAGDK